MTTRQLLFTTWSWSAELILAISLLVIAYLILIRFRVTRQSLFFFAGVLLLLVTLASPLTRLGHQYLFSAHMAQHMVVLLLVPPLLLAGIPSSAGKQIAWGPLRAGRFLPTIAWLAGVGIMWFWHVPEVFNATVPYSPFAVCGIGSTTLTASLLDVQYISLLIAGLLFSWPIVSPVKSQRLAPLSAIAYLFTACVGCSLLGLTITFSSTLLYTAYTYVPDLAGIGFLVRQKWGLTPEADQQIGGLLMWVPGCVLYLTAALYILMRWFKEEEIRPVAVTHSYYPDPS